MTGLFIGLSACALLLLAGRAAVTVRDAELSDFRCFYEAARLISHGNDPYDRATWIAATRLDPARLPPCPETFAYPLWTPIAMTPLAALPEPAALALWEVILLGCVLGGVALLSRTWRMVGGLRLLLLLVLSSQPLFSAIANAQLGPVVFLGLAGVAFALERGRARGAAAGWSLLLIKPNIVVLALVALPVLARYRRFAAHVAIDAAVITTVSLALVPTWPVDVVREILGQRLLADPDLGTLSALAMVAGLPASLGIGVSVVALGVFVVALPRRRLRPRELVAAVAVASFLITPYARPHDTVALAVCWAAALAAAGVVAPAAGRVIVATVIGAAFVLPWAVTVASLFGAPLALHVVTILATAASTAVALRWLGADARPVRASAPLS